MRVAVRLDLSLTLRACVHRGVITFTIPLIRFLWGEGVQGLHRMRTLGNP